MNLKSWEKRVRKKKLTSKVLIQNLHTSGTQHALGSLSSVLLSFQVDVGPKLGVQLDLEVRQNILVDLHLQLQLVDFILHGRLGLLHQGTGLLCVGVDKQLADLVCMVSQGSNHYT